MATLSETQWRTQIVQEVGDTSTQLLQKTVGILWDSNAGKGTLSVRLQYLYTKRQCIDLILGTIREDVDAAIPGGMASKEDQKSAHLQAMRQAVVDEIALLELQGRAAASPVALPLLTTAPIGPLCPGGRDANAPWLAGSPYYSSRPKQRWP